VQHKECYVPEVHSPPKKDDMSWDGTFARILFKYFKEDIYKGNPDETRFKDFGFVPQSAKKPFNKLKAEKKKEQAKEWCIFWIPCFCNYFGKDFREILKCFLMDTILGQDFFAECYNVLEKETGRSKETMGQKKKIVRVASLNKILKKSPALTPYHKVLHNKDFARVSMRQTLKMCIGGLTLGGLTGDQIARLTGRWPEFLRLKGFDWKITKETGYVEMVKIFENWISQILQSSVSDELERTRTLYLRAVWDSRQIKECPLGCFLIPVHEYFASQNWVNAFLVEAATFGETKDDLTKLLYYPSLLRQINNEEKPFTVLVSIQ
jgi:hypothetical protein